MVTVGDLVYLNNKKYLGVVIRIFHETKFNPPLKDAMIWWCGTTRKEWCLAEALTIIK